jgi:hypothetical protein
VMTRETCRWKATLVDQRQKTPFVAPSLAHQLQHLFM